MRKEQSKIDPKKIWSRLFQEPNEADFDNFLDVKEFANFVKYLKSLPALENVNWEVKSGTKIIAIFPKDSKELIDFTMLLASSFTRFKERRMYRSYKNNKVLRGNLI